MAESPQGAPRRRLCGCVAHHGSAGVARRGRAPDATAGRGIGRPQTTFPPLVPAPPHFFPSPPPQGDHNPRVRTGGAATPKMRRRQPRGIAPPQRQLSGAWYGAGGSADPPLSPPPPPPPLPHCGSHPHRHHFPPHCTAPRRGCPDCRPGRGGNDKRRPPPVGRPIPSPSPPPSRPGPAHDAPRKWQRGARAGAPVGTHGVAGTAGSARGRRDPYPPSPPARAPLRSTAPASPMPGSPHQISGFVPAPALPLSLCAPHPETTQKKQTTPKTRPPSASALEWGRRAVDCRNNFRVGGAADSC